MLEITIKGEHLDIKGNITKEEIITIGKLGEVIKELCENQGCKEGAE